MLLSTPGFLLTFSIFRWMFWYNRKVSVLLMWGQHPLQPWTWSLMISSQITTSGWSVWCLPGCLSGPDGPWQCGPSQERIMIRGRVQLKPKHIWVVCVCEKETVSHQMTAFYYIQSHVDCNHLVWIVHLFIAKHKELATLSWWRWEYTVQVPPLGREVPKGKRDRSPDLGHILEHHRHTI